MRRLVGLFTAVFLVFAVAAVAQAPRTDREALEEIAAILVEQGIVLPTTAPEVSTTLTTSAPSTTEVPTTTTTQAPTTTVAPTTTAADDPPATISLGNLSRGEGYTIDLAGLNSSPPHRFWWSAPYFFDLPYADGFGWAAGDRGGYLCAYGFLVRNASELVKDGVTIDLVGGTPYGRFTFVRLDQATYGRVNDTYMREGVRFYDGTATGVEATEIGSRDVCSPLAALPYEEYTGPDQRPVVVFYTPSGEVAEIRNYRTTVVGDNVKFRLVSATSTKVVVLAYENNLPTIVVYYDALNGGSVKAFLP